MDIQNAWERLQSPEDKTRSILGKAIETLVDSGIPYKDIASKTALSENKISAFHKLSKFPPGIQWLADQGVFTLTIIAQIGRLSESKDQELLAFCAFSKKLSGQDVKEAVDVAIKQNRPLREVLETLIGIRFDKVDEPILLPFSFEDRLKISVAAWARGRRWEDFCHDAIMEATRVDASQIGERIVALAKELVRDTNAST